MRRERARPVYLVVEDEPKRRGLAAWALVLGVAFLALVAMTAGGRSPDDRPAGVVPPATEPTVDEPPATEPPVDEPPVDEYAVTQAGIDALDRFIVRLDAKLHDCDQLINGPPEPYDRCQAEYDALSAGYDRLRDCVDAAASIAAVAACERRSR